MTGMIKTQSGILYPNPSVEIEAIVLQGPSWTSVIEYKGYHPMLPGPNWFVLDFNNSDSEWSK